MKRQFSDELINAFVDGELDDAEIETIEQAIIHDDELASRVKRLCELKKDIYAAYQDINMISSPDHGYSYAGKWQLKHAAVAMVMLVVGHPFLEGSQMVVINHHYYPYHLSAFFPFFCHQLSPDKIPDGFRTVGVALPFYETVEFFQK